MSPRPRTVDDTAILEAAVRVLSRTGPERLTLADVGAEAGLSAATLVQRFGSKRELQLSLLRHATENLDERLQSASAGHDSPLDALFAAAMDRAGPLDGPEALANRLGFYLSELGDPEFHALALDNSRRAIASFRDLLDNAIEAGELTGGLIDTEQLAETIYALNMGTLMSWTVSREESLREKIRRDLDVLLRPFRKGPRKLSSISRHHPRGSVGTKLSAMPPALR